MTRRKGGRPPNAPSQRRSKLVLIRLTPPEYQRLKAAARRKKTTVTELFRQAALHQTGQGRVEKERAK